MWPLVRLLRKPYGSVLLCSALDAPNLNLLLCSAITTAPLSYRVMSFHARVKHINVKHHYARECTSSNEISMSYVVSEDNIADGFTKALDTSTFQRIRGYMGLSV